MGAGGWIGWSSHGGSLGRGHVPIPCLVRREGFSGPQGDLYPCSTPTLTSLCSIPPRAPRVTLVSLENKVSQALR